MCIYSIEEQSSEVVYGGTDPNHYVGKNDLVSADFCHLLEGQTGMKVTLQSEKETLPQPLNRTTVRK